MAQDYVKRFLTKDGNTRISIYCEEYPDNPRGTTDEPLHCEDWARGYSIMTKDERESKSESARKFLEYMLNNYGDWKKIIDILVWNGKHMTDGKSLFNDALVYNRSEKMWELKSYMMYFNISEQKNEKGWSLNNYYDCVKYDLDVCDVLDCVHDGTIDYLVEHCMTDGIKMASYSFGYHGEVSFSDDVSCKSEGICWLEKDEFLKYAGGDNSEWVKKEEQVWKEKSLDEIEFLLDELKAWSDNEVYGFVVEDCIKSIINKRYTNVDRDDEEYEEEEWNETDSCWGFYGKLNEKELIEQAGYKIEELTEV